MPTRSAQLWCARNTGDSAPPFKNGCAADVLRKSSDGCRAVEGCPKLGRCKHRWPLVQRQDTRLWIWVWWFESTGANSRLQFGFGVRPGTGATRRSTWPGEACPPHALARVMRPCDGAAVMHRRRPLAAIRASSGTQLANVGRHMRASHRQLTALLRTVAQQAGLLADELRRGEDWQYPSAVAIRAHALEYEHNLSTHLGRGSAQAFAAQLDRQAALCTRRLVLLKPLLHQAAVEALRLQSPAPPPRRAFRASDRLSSRWPHGSSRAEVLQFIFRTGT